MNMRKHDTLTIDIDKMAFGGMGIGHVDGFVVFVKGGVPGDRLAVQVYKKKKDYAEARIVDLITPSAHRVEAPCPYFGYCGGCQWQHVKYDHQLAFKKAHVEESMRHIGALENVEVHDPIVSEEQFGYRNKMEFSFSDRRWFLPDELDRKGTEGGFALGLHVPGTFNKVIDIHACLLQREKGNEILQHVRNHVKACGIPVYGLKSHQGFWRFLTIRYSKAFDEYMVNLVTSRETIHAVQPLAETLNRNFGQVKSILNNITAKKAGIAVGEREVVLSGKRIIEDKIGSHIFQISANSFFQTHTAGAEKLYQIVADYGEFKGNETVLDLYSGTGTIPILLSPQVREIIGIELVDSAVQDARRNCEINNIPNCRFICGDLRGILHTIPQRPHVVVIDPPRAGMHKDVLASVLSMAPKKIVYVSCNPATLARDLGLMVQDYEVVEIQPVDMFPNTYHIESVAKLVHR